MGYLKVDVRTYSRSAVSALVADRFNELVEILDRMNNMLGDGSRDWKAIGFIESLLQTNHRILSRLVSGIENY